VDEAIAPSAPTKLIANLTVKAMQLAESLKNFF
jgi:hypothetical protein